MFDGTSIAWAATEYIASNIRAKTLFATHYHELTSLGESLDTVENVHVAADESDGDVTFLRTVRDGPTNRSYGVHVADLAGVPEPVVERSREVLDRLRDDKAIEVRGSTTETETQQAVFDLSSGQFRSGSQPDTPETGRAVADGSHEERRPGESGQDEGPRITERYGEDATEVLDTLADIDVNETPPVELMAEVQSLQERLDTDE
jgi:DNA mismatch repair protein MutS